MTTTILSKYIMIPVNPAAQKKRLEFYSASRLVFDIDVHIDMHAPKYYTYVNVERFIGYTFTVTSVPEMDFTLSTVDNIPDGNMYKEVYRPQIHFCAKYGWINDPNGLIYANGTYHMFFQHNPAGPVWGNLHWGHAVSGNLLNWTELDDVLFPDESGLVFSGSAIVDENNIAGLQKTNDKVILLYYTAAGGASLLSEGEKFTQHMAYSTDNGKSFQKYKGNPIIPHISEDNRDPRVIWCEDIKKYILALYLSGHEYQLFTSDNLIKWEKQQKITLPNDAECPDLYKLPVKNEAGTEKWIFGGASDTYLVGHFENGLFVQEQSFRPYRYGRDGRDGRDGSYAAQTFSGIQNRTVRMTWEDVKIPDTSFQSQVSVPCEMSLVKIGSEYRLASYPIEELEQLYIDKQTLHDLEISPGRPFVEKISKKPHNIEFVTSRAVGSFKLFIFGLVFDCQISNNMLIFLDRAIPLSISSGQITFRLIIDTAGIELFLDNGLIFSAAGFVSDYNFNYIKLYSDTVTTIEKLSIASFKSIWQ